MLSANQYFNYQRRTTTEVHIGLKPLGSKHSVRLQSMTTTPTTEVEASVEQSLRIIRAGADYVRLTAQGLREVEALAKIEEQLRERAVLTPLVADIHFNPRVADAAARVVEKVRINPGNYVDAARQFKHLDYTDEEYAAEIRKIRERFIPFLEICREHKTAIRIGVNHGSLSDRIMSRYGDTPEGIVESCMEFLRVCKEVDFRNVVLSIKASNPVVMVRAVRLLIAAMEREDMHYPLHLGVTEAGEGEDGRIISAVGIGALLADGIGDTIRVSLSEEPEREIPVARKLCEYIARRNRHNVIHAELAPTFDYLNPQRRLSTAVGNIGGASNVPVVISDREVKTGNALPDYTYAELAARYDVERLEFEQLTAAKIEELRAKPHTIIIGETHHLNPVGHLRALAHTLMTNGLSNPLIAHLEYEHNLNTIEEHRIEAAADAGALLFDGLIDGIWLSDFAVPEETVTSTAFSILQAVGQRLTRTRYISCPGCGRTLYDLQSTIRRIKEATADVRPMKIAIMGCIVNGPGEMADADYGYVGAARGKVSLYRGKQCVEMNIPEEQAVEKLLALIRQDEQVQNQ